MISFVAERYVNPNQTEQEAREGDLEHSDNPENNISTVALKNLKKTEDSIDFLKRRLSVLEIRDKKYEQKARDNQRKFELHESVQSAIAGEKNRKIRHHIEKQQKLDRLKQKLQCDRSQRIENLDKVRQELSKQKRKQYERIKQKMFLNEKGILRLKNQDLQAKVQKRKSVNQLERLARIHVEEFHQQKKCSLKESSAREGSHYQSRRSQRQKLLDQLSSRQSQLIHRQSASRAAFNQSYKKLYRVSPRITSYKEEKKTADQSSRLPPISSRASDELLML